MAVKKEIKGMVWQCECGKWNFWEAQFCWKCHEPKSDTPKPKRLKKEVSNVQ